MKKEIFTSAELEIIDVENEDVIVTSGEAPGLFGMLMSISMSDDEL